MSKAIQKAREALRAIIDTLDAEDMGEGPPASEHVAHWQKLHEDAQSAVAALDAAERSRLDATPKVKALRWRNPYIGIHYGQGLLGDYKVYREGVWWNDNLGARGTGGMTACDADYERRILSALDLPLPRQEPDMTHPTLDEGSRPAVEGEKDDTDFRLGDIVETAKGAAFWGEIIAFDNDGKSAGCTVLAIAPGFEGTKHVYPLKQLRRRALPSAPAVEGVESKLVERLQERAR